MRRSFTAAGPCYWFIGSTSGEATSSLWVEDTGMRTWPGLEEAQSRAVDFALTWRALQ